jgi:hypothetical protein
MYNVSNATTMQKMKQRSFVMLFLLSRLHWLISWWCLIPVLGTVIKFKRC